MTIHAELSADERTLTVTVPLAIRRRGGRKLVVVPGGADSWAPRPERTDNTLVKTLARAFRWRRMLESGKYASVAELAAAENISASYLARVLRLTLLAPEAIEAVLNGHGEFQLAQLLQPFPGSWEAQVAAFRLDHVARPRFLNC